LESTTDLLHREGYACDCVGDITGAARLLGENRYDLLIAEIKMPGDSELGLIRNMPDLAEGMPVILVTSHPWLGSAIESVRLGVKAYLVKPLVLRNCFKKFVSQLDVLNPIVQSRR